MSLQTIDISSGISSNVVGDIQTMFVAHPKHHLVNESFINGQYLSSETLILPSFQLTIENQHYDLIPYSEIILTTDCLSSLTFTEKDLGIAYVPDYIARAKLLAQRLKVLDVNSLEFNNIHSLMLYYRTDFICQDIINATLTGLKEWFGY